MVVLFRNGMVPIMRIDDDFIDYGQASINGDSVPIYPYLIDGDKMKNKMGKIGYTKI